jgi:hypothetical protein
MESITYPNDSFNYDNISLGQPTVIQGGSYFTKISNNSNVLYLQTPSCYTKQGINVSGKKAYCDLMYTNDDADILSWFEKLVERVQQLIYDKRKLWFHNDMEMEDIDSAFTPPVRTYKGGKFHLVRTYIQGSHINNPLHGFSCYDENENKVEPEILNSEGKKIIPLLEIKGVKFSSKSFQFDISLKQVMVIEETNFLNNCLIKLNTQVNKVLDNDESIDSNNNKKEMENVNVNELEVLETIEKSETVDSDVNANNTESNEDDNNVNTDNKVDNNKDDIVEPNYDLIDNTGVPPLLSIGLEEIDIDANDITDNSQTDFINIKSPNDAYVELWNAARDKAKKALKAAIIAHLDARKIKTENMLDNLDEDSDDDEFDAYVESLENLDLEN